MTISPETNAVSAKLIADRKYTFPILRDEKNAYAGQYNVINQLPEDLAGIYKAFGIDLAETNGEDSWTLPVPATYVIGTDGTIFYAHAEADYTRRPEPDVAVDAIR